MESLRVSTVLTLASLVLVLAACGSDSGGDPNESATTRAIRDKVRADMEVARLQHAGKRLASLNERLAEAPTATRLAVAMGIAEEPAEEVGLVGIARGEEIYTQNCSGCHGLRGNGDGPLGATLQPVPAKHSDGGYMNALSNDHLFKVIEQGGAAVGKSSMMAPWGPSLSDDEIWDVIEFVRSLATPAYDGPVRG